MSRVTAIISLWLSASSSACHGLLIITVITPLPTKPSTDKNARELKLANAAITDMQMRQRDVAALDAKYTKSQLMLKLKMMLCVMMLPLVVVSLHIKAVCQSMREATTPPAWIMQPLPDWQTPLNEIISPSEEADHYAKTTGRNPEVY